MAAVASPRLSGWDAFVDSINGAQEISPDKVVSSGPNVIPENHLRKRTGFESFASYVLAIAREIEQLFRPIVEWLEIVFKIENDDPLMETNFATDWKENSEGLYVMIHGLQGRPQIWKDQHREVALAAPNADIRVPYVPLEGHTSLEECAAPFLALVQKYIEDNPGKPVVLMGFSRGCQIASYVEVKLRESGLDANILISAVSGPYLGTRPVHMMEKLLDTLFPTEWAIDLMAKMLRPPVADELRRHNEHSQELLRMVAAPLPDGQKRHYEFYTTRDETAVFPFSSALPVVPYAERYVVLSGHSHNSVLSAVADMQVERGLQFLRT